MSFSGPLGETFGKRLHAYLTSPQDYRKYREKLSRELLRLRHELNLVTRDTKNYSEKEKTSLISAEQYAENEQYGKVLLLLAERKLVHFLEIKSMLEIKGQLIPGYKKLMLGKLKLAATTGRKLVAVVSNEGNPLKRLEYYVFSALLYGQYAVNKKRWIDARHSLSLARIGLEFLADGTARVAPANGGDSMMEKVLIDEILDTLVDPALALANLQDFSGGKTTADLRTVARKHCRDGSVAYLAPIVDIVSAFDPAFVEELAVEHVPKSVTWRTHSAAIYSDELAVKLNKIVAEDWALYKDANDWDSLFSRWDALVDIHQGDMEKSKDEDDMQKTQDNAVLLTYLKYNMLFVKVKRDLLLIEQLPEDPSFNTAKYVARGKDVVRLYESLTRTTEELKDLPGVYNDEHLHESLEQLSSLFSTQQSVVIADTYAAASKFPEALAMYLHIQGTFSANSEGYKVDAFPYDVSSDRQVALFKVQLSKQLAKLHILTQLQRETEGITPLTVTENVYKFPTSTKSLQAITKVAEKGFIAPVLSKPVLFDVAFNYIGYSAEGKNSLDKSTNAKIDGLNATDKKKGGFFGIFGRG